MRISIGVIIGIILIACWWHQDHPSPSAMQPVRHSWLFIADDMAA